MPIFKEGKLERTDPLNPGSKWHFPCHVIRLWELPPDQFLTAVNQSDVPGMLNQIFARYRAEPVPDLRDKLFLGTYVLMGLRYNAEWVESLFKRAVGMEESSTYQLLIRRGEERGINKGRALNMRGVIHEFMGQRLGPIPPELNDRLEKLSDLAQLERMRNSILTASSWEELFAISPPPSE